MDLIAETQETHEIQLDKKNELRYQRPVVEEPAIDKGAIDGPYAKYVLFVLFFVAVLNFLDRSILGVLVEDIKADLGLSDADMGFIGGAAFGVFYATFGMALGRLADVWNRKKLTALGLGFWSLMTALSGLARSFVPLAACRFGVGVGESCASPASISILYDYFSPRIRTTVLGIYYCGGAIGGGLGILLGGMILDSWNNAWPDSSIAPFGLRGWQAAFIILGVPGILVAFWVASLREPRRGQGDGIVSKPHSHPFREAFTVLMSMVPVGNLWLLAKAKRTKRPIIINGVVTLIILVSAYSLIQATGSILQWVAMAIGVYAVFSWAQVLAVRDPVIFGMIFRCKTMLYLITGMTVTLLMAGIMFWTIPFFQRYHGISASQAGAVLGMGGIITGVAGMLVGSILADKLRAHTGKGKLYVVSAGMICAALFYLIMLTAEQLIFAYAAALTFSFAFSLMPPAIMSTLNDLMLPRGRATISAFYIMLAMLSSSALSPYLIGLMSDAITLSGANSGEALRQSMLWILLASVVGLVLIALSIRTVEADEASLKARACALGEKIE